MKIKNWSHFQHFKDRRPPWIKLYRELLDDMEWHLLDGNSAKTLVMLWLIASETKDGELPSVEVLCFRLRLKETELKQQLTKLSHWLEQDDINVISSRYQDDLPETETETETKEEKETEKKQRGSRLPKDWVPDSDLANWSKAERPDLDLKKVLSEFRDYWVSVPGQKGVKLDWDATWRNWVRNQKAERQTFAQQAADIAKMTIPSRQTIDPVLLRLEEERKNAVPMPAHIRDQINSALKKA